MSGQTWLMTKLLNELMARHQQVLQPPPQLARADAVDYPLQIEGLASTVGNVDAERVLFTAFAFGNPLPQHIPLTYEHDLDQLAGTVDELKYDLHGNLEVRATVTHQRAKLCGGFSIGVRALAFEIRNADRADFYAEISSAELTELALTDFPVNPRALVKSRSRVPPHSEYFLLMQQRVRALQKRVRHFTEECR